MVSLFGMKLGGEKKKARSRSRGAKEAPPKDEDLPAVPRGIFSSARPGSSQSQKFFSRKSKFFPYGAGADGALSMANLPRPKADDESPLPSPAFLRPTTSNPNLNTSWKGGSTTSLAAPTRPKIPPPPLDLLSAPQSTPGTTTGTGTKTPKSPLGAYELTLNLPSERLSLFGDFDEMLRPPEPLRIKKQSPTTSKFPDSTQQMTKPPSPPVSVQASTADDASIPERPSRVGQESLERSLRRVDSNQTYGSRKELESPIDPAASDVFALPTPPMSVARSSDERPSTGASNQWGEPVIQNVRGKRDTMIVKPTRRMSFQKYVEDFSKGLLPLSDEPAPAIPAMSSKRAERPAPLNLNIRNDVAIQAAPRSAPLGLSQRPLLAQIDNNPRPPAAAAAPPLSAGIPYSRPAHPYTSKVYRPSADEYGCFPEDGQDDLEEDRPPTPDSPLLPLSGPLASPLIRPDVEEESEDPLERMRNFRFPAVKPDENTLTPRYRPPSSIRESFHTADWPLPSPVHPPKEVVPVSPRLPDAQPDAQVRSFSRPWTPKKDTTPLSLHDSPESFHSSVTRPHIASQVAKSGQNPQPQSPVANGFDSKGGFF
ncbi:uncharacterized protein B0I36DRAFT_345415 [Microdochium trichocladiopsis]|uniref:Uncharacterized protein n=1 Tax=Microdochium trichocladiopsis TaxID=1682393 RepID=A0A9P9BTS1_9PEZI|nr:uncharacterized protein B0I36DRAFT_345415 [Microdochium trichocladiopsis]KAH7037272.1 hypothetical protein B0I36DRAFT_345415 [Microdochium trichocladiopsis]